ncbi:MAG: hypothetical protein GY938_26985 [Ketobacter sp.]|nr:hypothetical protein [Ketobacter sp.]
MTDKQPVYIKLTYESLIAILQGKETHMVTPDMHLIIKPPFDGVFLTHAEIDEMRYRSQIDILDMAQGLATYKEVAK